MNSATTTGVSPHISASQALLSMLKLIGGSERIADITSALMQRSFGVPIQTIGPQQFGYGQRLPGNWAFSILRQDVGTAGPRVDLIFDPLPGMRAALADIGKPDFDDFTSELQAMGFERQPYHGEHYRWICDVFERASLRVEVYPAIAHADNGEAIGSACVKMVLVR